jgi:hypothetical protein
MRDENEGYCPTDGTTSGSTETPTDLLDAMETFLLGLSSGIDRWRCADLASAVTARAVKLRSTLMESDGETDLSCFSRIQRERRRETARLEVVATEEIAAPFHSLAAGYPSLEPGVLHDMIADFSERLRTRSS